MSRSARSDSSVGADSKSAIDGPDEPRDGRAATSKTVPSRTASPRTARSLCGRRRWRRNPPGCQRMPGAVPRSGSDNIGPPTVSVRIATRGGRKRTHRPGLRTIDRDTEPDRRRDSDRLPAVPVAIEVTIPPLPPPLPPVERIQPPRLVVGELGTAKIDTTTDPLFGLAGLILIPAVGAALGYRQARAAQALRESARTVGPCAGSCPTTTSGSRR